MVILAGVMAPVWLLLCSLLGVARGDYLPTWDSLDSRPLPTWYDEAKVGIFIHWGVFSVPSFASEWFWYQWKDPSPRFDMYRKFMNKSYPPGFTYQDFGKDFNAQFFDPNEWADIFTNSGAQYVVLTSKHHEGFTMWPSKYSFGWNARDVGPHRDLVGDLARAIRGNTTLHFGLYHSLYEWFNPLWLADKAANFSTRHFVHSKVLPEMKELVETYKPEIVWSDGENEAMDWYWESTAFLAWLYNSSPVKDTVVTNDRWGHGIPCKHGGFFTCADRYNPGVLQPHKWENCLTIDKRSWGFRREARVADFLTSQELIKELVVTVSCGGNILINVGPTKEGTITPIYEERLRQFGAWLKVNGEAIYKSKPWTFQNETVQTGVWYTRREGLVYAAALEWPKSGMLTLHHPEVGDNNQVLLLGFGGNVKWHTAGRGINIIMPEMSRVKSPLPWVFKFTNITN